MSLTSFVKLEEVRERLRPFRPIDRKIPKPLLVVPGIASPTLIGTAFDYLLRFELLRRAPHAVNSAWVAERAPDLIWRKTARGGAGISLSSLFTCPSPYRESNEMTAARAQRVIRLAKKALKAYRQVVDPTTKQKRTMARHALRLAKLDSVYRAFRLDPQFDSVDKVEVDELIELLRIVPIYELIKKRLLLNPDFGMTSRLVGAADADLIVGDCLIDIKTTKFGRLVGRHLDQLFGYFLLSLYERQQNRRFPRIKRVGVYFSRHGHLWTLPTNVWTSSPGFAALEKWFAQKAREVYGGPSQFETN